MSSPPMGGVRGVPETAKPHKISAKTAKPHRKVAKNRKTRMIGNTTLISLFLPRKSYVDLKNEETEGISRVSVYFMTLKSPRMFENDRNRKTATQNGQKPKNNTRFLERKRELQATIETAKPQKNCTKNRQKPQKRTKK